MASMSRSAKGQDPIATAIIAWGRQRDTEIKSWMAEEAAFATRLRLGVLEPVAKESKELSSPWLPWSTLAMQHVGVCANPRSPVSLSLFIMSALLVCPVVLADLEKYSPDLRAEADAAMYGAAVLRELILYPSLSSSTRE